MEEIKNEDSWTPNFLFTPFHNYPHLDSSLNSVDNTFDHSSEDYVKSLSMGGYLMVFLMLIFVLIICGLFFLLVKYWLRNSSIKRGGNKYMMLLLMVACAGIVLGGLLLELLFYFITISKLASTREKLIPGDGDINSKKYPTYQNTYNHCLQYSEPGGLYYLDDNAFFKWREYKIPDVPEITEEIIKEDFKRVTEICQPKKDKIYDCFNKIKEEKVKKKPFIIDAVKNPFTKILNHRGYCFAVLACGWAITLVAILLLTTCLDLRKLLVVGVILALICLCGMSGLLTAEAMAISDACQAPDKLLSFLEKKKTYSTTIEGPEPDCIQWYKDRNDDVMRCMFVAYKYHDCLVANADIYPLWFYGGQQIIDYKDSIAKTSINCIVGESNRRCPSPTSVTATKVYDTRGTLYDFCGYGSEFWIVLLQLLGVMAAAVIMSVLLCVALANMIRKRNLDGDMRSDFSTPTNKSLLYGLTSQFRPSKGKFLKSLKKRGTFANTPIKWSKLSRKADSKIYKKSKKNEQEILPETLENKSEIRPYIDNNFQRPEIFKSQEIISESLVKDSGTNPYLFNTTYQSHISNRHTPDNVTEEALSGHTRRSRGNKTVSKYKAIQPTPQPLTPKSSYDGLVGSHLQDVEEYPTTDYLSSPKRRRLSHQNIHKRHFDYGYPNCYNKDIITSGTSLNSGFNMKSSAQTYNQYQQKQKNASSSNDCPTFDWDASSLYDSKTSESDSNNLSEASSDTIATQNVLRERSIDRDNQFHNRESYSPNHRQRMSPFEPPIDINDRKKHSRGGIDPHSMYDTVRSKTLTNKGTPSLCCSCPTCEINQKKSRRLKPVSYFEYRLDSKPFELKTYMNYRPISIQLNSLLDTPSLNDFPSPQSRIPQNLALSASPVQISVSPLYRASQMPSSSLEITFLPSTSVGPSVTSNSLSESGCRLSRQQCNNRPEMDIASSGSMSMPSYLDIIPPTSLPDSSSVSDSNDFQNTHCRRSSPGCQDVKTQTALTANQNSEFSGTLSHLPSESAAGEKYNDVLRLTFNQPITHPSYEAFLNAGNKSDRKVYLEVPATWQGREHVLDETEEDTRTPHEHSENEMNRQAHDMNS